MEVCRHTLLGAMHDDDHSLRQPELRCQSHTEAVLFSSSCISMFCWNVISDPHSLHVLPKKIKYHRTKRVTGDLTVPITVVSKLGPWSRLTSELIQPSAIWRRQRLVEGSSLKCSPDGLGQGLDKPMVITLDLPSNTAVGSIKSSERVITCDYGIVNYCRV